MEVSDDDRQAEPACIVDLGIAIRAGIALTLLNHSAPVPPFPIIEESGRRRLESSVPSDASQTATA